MYDAPPGIVGLETCVPLVFTQLIDTGKLTLSEAIAKMTCAPAKILQIDRGTLSIGAIADVIDNRSKTIGNRRSDKVCVEKP